MNDSLYHFPQILMNIKGHLARAPFAKRDQMKVRAIWTSIYSLWIKSSYKRRIDSQTKKVGEGRVGILLDRFSSKSCQNKVWSMKCGNGRKRGAFFSAQLQTLHHALGS